MKLNRLQRHTAYIIMLAEAEELDQNGVYGLCLLVWNLFHFGKDKEKWGMTQFVDSLQIFPELLKYQPRDYERFWFPRNPEGWQKRIEILNKCIKETA